MTGVPYRIAPLDASHIRDPFHSGEEALDRYLKNQAGQDARRGYTRVFAAVRQGERTVLGYYTLSTSAVDLSRFPEPLAHLLPRYDSVPAVLLGRLAVDAASQKKGLGALLLADALRRSCGLLDTVGWAFFIVQAKHEAAAAFYRHFGFTPFPQTPLLLFLDRKAALHSIGK